MYLNNNNKRLIKYSFVNYYHYLIFNNHLNLKIRLQIIFRLINILENK